MFLGNVTIFHHLKITKLRNIHSVYLFIRMLTSLAKPASIALAEIVVSHLIEPLLVRELQDLDSVIMKDRYYMSKLQWHVDQQETCKR